MRHEVVTPSQLKMLSTKCRPPAFFSILDVVEPHDLVITADIPLADKVIDKHAVALNPRGTLYTKENIKQRLSVRNFNEVLRSTGIQTGGPKVMSKQDIQQFANALDRYMAKKVGGESD